ncbi:hypothetical protein ABID16_003931 [Rhizobium aquaticum]|uniref:Uncharacterized protein n=1 Tax=Rhizobium aquaticum TaxID=1549636 RepID=A0ABV2J498_9HYPH
MMTSFHAALVSTLSGSFSGCLNNLEDNRIRSHEKLSCLLVVITLAMSGPIAAQQKPWT